MTESTAQRATSSPVMSHVQVSDAGRTFNLTFHPGDVLPAHSSPSRLTISVMRGSGMIELDDTPVRVLEESDFVQMDPGVMHTITAGDSGLELVISTVENCCRIC